MKEGYGIDHEVLTMAMFWIPGISPENRMI
jgi:hypothetical protein